MALFLAGCAGQTPEGPWAPGLAPGEEASGQLTAGHRLMEAGEHELALRAYTRAALEEGPSVEVLAGLGSANLRLGRLGQAERLLRRAVEAEPEAVTAWNNLGVVLIEQGRAGEAERVFRRAYALDSGRSAAIRDNLRLALSKVEARDYPELQKRKFALVRRGRGDYLILPHPD
ncbi:tetratricopeptide repeat protein [Roseitranquillus sediminis]|uniref:tetratricopeptide repeat protein n=1 Tax=Roseitranquillus sediminis TaxID=2809051 RepID=UPI002223DDDD|nr:tetratricopeptide repeat protein [Roseitranquillus sediminis]